MTADELYYGGYNTCRSTGVCSYGMEGGAVALNRSNEAALLQLMERTGYNIVQENGQRKYGGPPPDWDGNPPPPKGSEVFVGKIPRDCFEDELVPVFGKMGQIYEFRLMMDFSGSNRGYAFVMYTAPGDAQQAVKMLNNYEIRKGKYLGVVKSVDNCRLFVGGIPKTKSKEEIKDEMSKVTEGVVNVILYSSVTDKTKSRGFAFVEYENHRSAAMARRKLIPGKIQLWGQEIAVDWAEPEPEVDEETMSKVTVLYVRNLMLTTTEEELQESFDNIKAGAVEKVKKLRDFAFVHFRTREEAQVALNAMNDTELDGSRIEVTWAKPVEKSFLRYNKNGYPQQAPVVGNAVGVLRSPVRTSRGRGAAGIRNGRGSVYVNYMPRHHVEQSQFFEIQTGMRLIPINAYKPYKTFSQTLVELCHKNNWGEPGFQLISVPVQRGEGCVDVPLYVSKVIIPAFPNAFQLTKPCPSLEDAKQCAAELVLNQLGIPVDAAYDQHAFYDAAHQYPISVQQQQLY